MAKKKKFQAIKADVGDYKGIRHDGKEMRFRKDDTFIIKDEGLARELDSMYGRKGTQKLSIVPYTDMETNEPGHKYTFSGVDTTGFKKKDNGYVWVFVNNRQIRMKKNEAQEKGLLPQRRIKRRKGAEATIDRI